MVRKLSAVVFIFLSLTYVSCKKESPQSPVVTPPVITPPVVVPPVVTVPVVYNDNDNLLMGNPSAASDLHDTNYLMRKPAYTLSYNRSRGIPNWVSWHLDVTDIGGAARQDDFFPDTNLPSGWYSVTTESYSASGFDRGHDCPSGDRTSSTTLNSYTFLMTNIIPQAPVLNQGIWADFENYTRELSTAGNEEYIIMGNYGKGGTGNNGYTATIDNGRVTVPATIWKVVVVIAKGGNDTLRIDANTRVIAVQMPNNNNVGNNWKSYRTSVDAIENATGLDLLSRLPAGVQNAIEAKVDNK